MNPLISALIIPVFLFLILIEYWVSKKMGKKNYNLDSTVSNLSIGVLERVLDVFLQGVFFYVFSYIYQNYAFFHISNSWYVWLFLLILTDFVWYWYHRLGHEINLLWAFHIVHHQSEDYNLSVAARVTNFQSIIRNVFWCILPLIGFRPEMVSIILVVHAGYSFFTHTEFDLKIDWLENILITPALHGVHHASNPEYLDKNYGDMFVFWDKLFGTFKKPIAPPVYGLTVPLESHSFLWQHFHYLIEIGYRLRLTKSVQQKINILFGKPEVMTGNERAETEKIFLSRNKDIQVKSNLYKYYIGIQLFGVLILSFGFIYLQTQLTQIEKTYCISLIFLTLVNCGALLEQKRWILVIEYLRLFLLVFVVSVYLEYSALCIVLYILSALLLFRKSYIEEGYYRFMFDLQTK